MRSPASLVCLFTYVVCGVAASSGQSRPEQPDMSAKLDQVVVAYQASRKFMGSVLVAQGGKTLLEKGYGSADLEWNVPNGPDTKFRLGSITKQFTATAILQLVEQGKLSVTDTACKYFDGCPDAWKKITIHQLLSHTSGIPNYTDDPDFPKPKFLRVPLTPAEIVLLSKNKPLEFEPGTKWKYDNTGYILLGAILEKVTGEKYADYVKKHIFEPVGMLDSGYDDTAMILPHRASGYQPCGQALCNSDYIDMSLPFAAGSLYSTVQDLYKWDRALDTDQLLKKSSRDRMFTPVMHDYAYGWILETVANHKSIGHGGGIPGFSTYIGRFPAENATLIVLGNNIASNPHDVAAALAGTLFGEKVELPGQRKEIHVDASVLDRYAGSYQLGPLVATITQENGRLMIQLEGQPKLEAFASSETQFFLKVMDATITFAPDATGKAQEFRIDQSGKTFSARRVK